MLLDNYKLIRKIQENKNNVTVDLIQDIHDGKHYVMKSIASSRRDHKNGIKEEVEIMNRINHRNIMKVEKYCQNVDWNGQQIDYYLMEYACKQDLFSFIEQYQTFKQKVCKSNRQELTDILNRSPLLPLFMVKHIAKELGQAVHFIHQKLKVAHMDIKLENVMIRDNYELVLSDFGQTLSTKHRQTKAKGTEFYMSPEVLVNYKYNQQKLFDSGLADSFSLGIVIYALTFGVFPWKYASVYDNQYRMFLSDRQQFWEQKMEKVDIRVRNKYMDFVEILNGLFEQECERMSVGQFVQKMDVVDGCSQVFNRSFIQKVYNPDDLDDLIF